MTQPTVSMLEHIEKLIESDRRANDQRFAAQEKAIETAEHNRDVAIKKAEDSIEKKSDAVYVKVTDLEGAFAKVMLRPEVESRFEDMARRLEDLKTSRDTGAGKGQGMGMTLGFIVTTAGFVATIVGLILIFT